MLSCFLILAQIHILCRNDILALSQVKDYAESEMNILVEVIVKMTAK